MKRISYSEAILSAFQMIMKKDKNVILIGQGLWSPWYVGDTMRNLDKKFGKQRIIDSPVSENAVTGIAFGASLTKTRPVVIHPRMDFMILALDQIVNQAAKWRSMMGGNSYSNLTIRSIINRGGEQGAQHSQSLHSWLAHIPGLVVMMPATVQDAFDLLISSVKSNNPVVFIDDRWLYNDTIENFNNKFKYKKISNIQPKLLNIGRDITIVGLGYGTKIGIEVSQNLRKKGLFADLIDLRMLNPLKLNKVIKSVKKTKKILVIDPAWKNCSISSEVIATVSENLKENFTSMRCNIFPAPAPTAKNLEKIYYFNVKKITSDVIKKFF
jgi:pyruvate/2-oxoglutarate/acetoin dehydrogenase E1 component